ncbi:MAG: hypothetical protein ACI3VN_02125 [Candidatus Onthomonas sp.]
MTELSLGRMRIQPGFLLILALLLVYDNGSGLPLLLGLAGLCHELGHLLAAWLLGLEVRQLRLGFFGAELDLSGLAACPWWGEALLLAAGPGINLVLSALCCVLPGKSAHLFGAVNLLLACFNLAPIPPLDGGRLLAVLSARLLPGVWGLTVSDVTAGLARGLLLGLGAALAWRGNFSLLLLALWLILGQA